MAKKRSSHEKTKNVPFNRSDSLRRLHLGAATNSFLGNTRSKPKSKRETSFRIFRIGQRSSVSIAIAGIIKQNIRFRSKIDIESL